MYRELTAGACREAMVKIVENVFHTMLQADVGVGTSVWVEDTHALTAFVDFTGPYRAVLLLQCSTDEAKQLARLFMGSEGDDLDGESRDAMGELLNIIAGNLKPILPKGTRTTLPSVVDAAGRPPHQGDTLFVIKTPFTVDNGMFCLTFAQDDAETTLSGAGGME